MTRHKKACTGNRPSTSNTQATKRKQETTSKATTPKRAMFTRVQCSICDMGFATKRARDEHAQEAHDQSAFDMYSEYLPRYILENSGAIQCIKTNTHLIMKPHFVQNECMKLNFFRFNMISLNDIVEHLHELFNMHGDSFKLNLSFGYILYNTQTDSYSYFYPGNNEMLLPEPFSISQPSDIPLLVDILREKDILHHVQKQRPNTNYRVVHITNVQYMTYNRGYVLGNDEFVLPAYIQNLTSITSLIKNSKGKKYNDRLCMFRALAVHRNNSLDVEHYVTELFSKWMCYKKKSANFTFEGVKIEEIPLFEETYDVNVNVYELNEDGSVISIFNSVGLRKETLYLNKYMNHVSLVNNFHTYAKKFACKLCQRHFNRRNKCTIHEQICDQMKRFKYPGGTYKLKKTIFKQLESLHIYVSKENCYFPHFCVFDMESKLVTGDTHVGDKTTILSSHCPISVSVSSSLHQRAQCYISDNPEELVEKMMEYCESVQSEVSRMMTLQFNGVFSILNEYKTACTFEVTTNYISVNVLHNIILQKKTIL